MWGGLRRPHRPFQVLCILVVISLTAAVSLQVGLAAGPGAQPIPDKPNLGTLGERLNTNTIAIVSGNSNATYLSIAYDLSAVLDDRRLATTHDAGTGALRRFRRL